MHFLLYHYLDLAIAFSIEYRTMWRALYYRCTNMKFDSIVFDCDGVLIDSEMLANQSEVKFLKSIGIEFDLSDFMARFVGKTKQMSQISDWLKKDDR
jgi:hypothetical protein